MKKTGYGVIDKTMYKEGFRPSEYYSKVRAQKAARMANREFQRINPHAQKVEHFIAVKY